MSYLRLSWLLILCTTELSNSAIILQSSIFQYDEHSLRSYLTKKKKGEKEKKVYFPKQSWFEQKLWSILLTYSDKQQKHQTKGVSLGDCPGGSGWRSVGDVGSQLTWLLPLPLRLHWLLNTASLEVRTSRIYSKLR